jgi:DnaK suppressor protein
MDRQALRERILAEIETTRSQVEQYTELSAPIAPENAIGRVSRMDAINNRSVNQAALRTAENKLHNLTVALSKVDEPDFGHCIGCGQPIPVGRLMLMPQAVRCLPCAR